VVFLLRDFSIQFRLLCSLASAGNKSSPRSKTPSLTQTIAFCKGPSACIIRTSVPVLRRRRTWFPVILCPSIREGREASSLPLSRTCSKRVSCSSYLKSDCVRTKPPITRNNYQSIRALHQRPAANLPSRRPLPTLIKRTEKPLLSMRCCVVIATEARMRNQNQKMKSQAVPTALLPNLSKEIKKPSERW